MSTLISRDNRNFSRRQGNEVAFDPFRIMDALLGGEAFAPFDNGAGTRAFAPTFEVRETKDAYVFKADVPGIPEKELEIHLTGNVLAISGERRQEEVKAGERYFALERGYGHFSRSFALPEGTDAEHVTADVKEGVLTVSVPKKPEVQPRRISVGVGTGNAVKA